MKIIGVDRRSMPSELHGRRDWKVVLVAREPNEVVAYRGMGSDEFVMQFGDKLSLWEARAHFPDLEAHLRQRGLSYDG